MGNVKPEILIPEPLPLSLLNDYLYCHRRAALKIVEGWRSANEHTNRGDIVHEHADLAGYEVLKGVTLLRALPVFSERLGLNGKCDIVEVTGTLPNGKSPTTKPESLLPVEFKLGKRRKWDNDDVQLCAQALCLEEMFGVPIPRGAIFHADSKRRRDVPFDEDLRRRTLQAITDLHQLVEAQSVPPAEYREACHECSLFEICQPRASEGTVHAARLARQLFEV